MTRADDMVAITDLLGRYSFGADGVEPSAYAEVFTEDGAFVGRVGQPDEVRIVGREALERFSARAIGSRGGRLGRHHQSSTTFVSLTEDTAITRSYLLVTAVIGAAAPRAILTSTYEDHLVRTPAGWRIHERRALPDVTGVLGERMGR
jgi:hypothetical protein